MMILYPSYLIAKILNVCVSYYQTYVPDPPNNDKPDGKMLDAANLAMIVFYCTVISFIELKLVQLVYILPDKLRWKLIEAEACAGIYAVISSAIFFSALPDSNWKHTTGEIFYEIFDVCVFLVLAILSFINARKLANAPQTLAAIKLFQRELSDETLSTNDFSASQQDEVGELDELINQIDALAFEADSTDDQNKIDEIIKDR